MTDYVAMLDALGEAVQLPIQLFIDGNCVSGDRATGGDSPFLHDTRLYERLKPDALIPDSHCDSVYYGMVRLDERACLVVGPCSVFPLTEDARHEYMTLHGMTDFQNYTIPVALPRRVKSALTLAVMACGGKASSLEDLPPKDAVETAIVHNDALTRAALDSAEAEKRHHSYRFEKEAMALLKSGDEAAVEAAFFQVDYSQIGTMAHSPSKQSEYLAVLTVSLMVRAAIEAHVDTYRAYAINDAYLQRISETDSSEQHRQLMLAAARQLAREVHSVRTRQRSLPHVERAKQYIRANLNREITLDEVSREVGVSPNHLSAIFKKQEGITMKAFILRERIEAAKSILCHTNEPIASIAAYLRFASHSHLSIAFKKMIGETPTEYRNRNQIIQKQE